MAHTKTNIKNVAVMPAPAFVTPEQAAEADMGGPPPTQPTTFHRHAPPKGRGPKAWLAKWKHLSRNKKIIILSIIAGLLIAGGLIWWFVLRDKPQPAKPATKQEAKVEEPPKPTTVASRLTGVQVAPELNNLPMTGVMIENSPDARPQAGLYDAGVVYEAIAEGGITRFLALFLETKPGYIGPVRSVRPYFLDFLVPYDAAIAHAGGSGEALAQIKREQIKDIDHGANGSTFQRVNNRFAPHNLYTSRDALLTAQSARGYNSSNFSGFVRKADKQVSPATARTIDLTISGFLYNPHFDYDATNNTYYRSEGGKPHMDEKAAKQINPKVIVVLVMSHRYAGVYSQYGTTGSGKAYFFQDGTMTEGIWEKSQRNSQFKFGDANGAPLALNAGQTWVSIVSSAGAVVAKP
ncbi:MAG TPA: DUF3048 domain-containing protein [Verrucomicrobiae bacterium]|nr:DUF3048 domain-containing protein [Verrucomicrobiae bacterium]